MKLRVILWYIGLCAQAARRFNGSHPQGWWKLDRQENVK